MNTEELISQAKRIIKRISHETQRARGAQAEVSEFLRLYAGTKSAFYERAKDAAGMNIRSDLVSILEAFVSHVESGLNQEVSPERQAQIDVVSDFLDQARLLLDNRKVHPGAAAVLIGATLEEFLRTWIEIDGLSLGNRKPCLDAYTKLLREEELITKQDVKDITSWGGTRNHAAHGEWEEVKDRSRIRIMLEGVNLFMRKYEK